MVRRQTHHARTKTKRHRGQAQKRAERGTLEKEEKEHDEKKMARINGTSQKECQVLEESGASLRVYLF